MDVPPSPDLDARLARLEAQVAWLLQQQQAGPPAAPAPPPRPPRPRRTLSPVVWVAGIASPLFLLGAGFLLRWAVQQGWLGPGLRFALGLAAGGAITAYAARLLPGEGRRLGTALLVAGLGTLQFTFRAGALLYGFYPAPAGLAAVVGVTALAAALAVRAGRGGALTASVASGLAAPLMFAQGGHHEVALAAYLVALAAAALAVPWRVPEAARWAGPRWTAVLGAALMFPGLAARALPSDAPALAGLLALFLVAAGLGAWLPGVAARPATPAALWMAARLPAAGAAWFLWWNTRLPAAWFAAPLVALAALDLLLLAPVRRRMGAARMDEALLALAAAHLALAVPVALGYRWTGTLWGALALAVAWGADRERTSPAPPETPALGRLATGLAVLATLAWAGHLQPAWTGAYGSRPLLNPVFLSGALVSGAWALLARRNGLPGRLAFVALEGTANLTLGLEAARIVQWVRPPFPGQAVTREASVALTLAWALSGAWQWMRALGRPDGGRALAAAGYVWMGLAGLKLVLLDLDRADTPLRALAFLGVGGIGMAAAVLAHRRRGGAA